MTDSELPLVDARLPLHRLDDAQTYLVAIQDVFVPEELRGRGIGTELSRAAERLAGEHGYEWISISASIAN